MIFIKHKSVGALIDCDYADAFLFQLQETNIIGSAQEFVYKVLAGIHITYIEYRRQNYIHDRHVVCLRPGCYRKRAYLRVFG